MRTARERHPDVLLLARGPETLATLDVQWAADLSIRVSAACAGPGINAPLQGRRLQSDHGLRPRAVAARAATELNARTAGVPGALLWALKTDPWLRRKLRTVDLVLSADTVTDRAIALVPELIAPAVVLPSRRVGAVLDGLRSLSDVLDLLDSQCSARIVEGRIAMAPLDADVLAQLRTMIDPGQARAIPPTALPTARTMRTIRWLAAVCGPEPGAEVVVDILGHFDWGSTPDAGRSGLSAQRASAAIWMAPDPTLFPPDPQLAEAATAALAGADDALADGEQALARALVGDAMTLLFHRERHAETLQSPLVTDPAAYLGPLYASTAFRNLVTGGSRPRVQRRSGTEPEAPHVLVLAGAYGNFHGPVVEALRDEAAVTLRRPKRLDRFFARKGMDPQLIDALAALRGIGPSVSEDEWSVRELTRDLRHALVPRLRRADVVFTDWADRTTVWASHLLPADARLVVRIHSLDALHPSFHLVDWGSVDEVIVVSEPLRRLVSAMLQVAGAEVPVRVVANLAALHESDQPKAANARTTLGMVGWGRRVKDPLWALELLAREPSWRLVLIGPDLPGRGASAKAYLEEVHRRLEDPDIRDRVEVVGWTDDVAAHLRKVGIILSTSRRESWHLGLVEGAASGAVPVVRNWPLFAPIGGARSLFPQEWVVESLDEAEARIRAVTADPEIWESARLEGQKQALELFDPGPVAQRYRDVVLGPLRLG